MKPSATDASDEDDSTLWAQWLRDRDPRSRALLLERHLPYARTMAAMLYAQRPSDEVAFDDYLQLARLGLLEAFERYQPDHGAGFRTFAAKRVRGAVLDGLAVASEQAQQVAFRRRVLNERSSSLAAVGRDGEDPIPSSSNLSGVFERLADAGVGLAIGFLLENTGMFDPGPEKAGQADGPYAAVELRHTKVQLLAHLQDLPERERSVVSLHYLQGHAFHEIAERLGLTKGRISQLHRRGLAMLRAKLAERAGCDQSL